MKSAEGTKGRRSAGSIASQRRARIFADQLRPTIQALRDEGLSFRQIADLLNEWGKRTRLGGMWQGETIRAVLKKSYGRGATRAAVTITAKANARRAELGPLVRQLRDTGLTFEQVADELTNRGVPTERGGRWHPTSVIRLIKHQ